MRGSKSGGRKSNLVSLQCLKSSFTFSNFLLKLMLINFAPTLLSMMPLEVIRMLLLFINPSTRFLLVSPGISNECM